MVQKKTRQVFVCFEDTAKLATIDFLCLRIANLFSYRGHQAIARMLKYSKKIIINFAPICELVIVVSINIVSNDWPVN